MRDVDAEQLRRAVRDLADPPDGAGWNTADLADALDGGPLRPAAVLVPFVRRGDDLSVLFTRRADHLRNHAGQVSFPGGAIDPGDAAGVLPNGQGATGSGPILAAVAGLAILGAAGLLLAGLLDPPLPEPRRGVQPRRRHARR